MKPLALFLTGLIVYISYFAGSVKPFDTPVKNDCCKHTKTTCQHAPKQKRSAEDGCGQSGCTAMFSCELCGFIVGKSITMKPVYFHQLPKPVAHYSSGNIAGYHPDNWKPPQTC